MTKPPLHADWRDNYHWFTHETLITKGFKATIKYSLLCLTKVEVVGAENVPRQGGGILACNHVNNFDPLFVGTFVPRHPHFMAKRVLYKNPIIRWLFRAAGSFPVYRGERDEWAFRQAGRVLAAGSMLCMFPEGTRSGAQLQKGKTGTVKLAAEHGVPVIPMSILGTHTFRFDRGRSQQTVRLQFAPPLDIPALVGEPPHSYEAIRHNTQQLMETIAAMLPPQHRGVYGDDT